MTSQVIGADAIALIDLSEPADERLRRRLEEVAESRELRAVVLSAERWTFANATDAGTIVETCAGLPSPVIAAIGGSCFEEGLELALACDVRIAGPRATFRMNQVGEGRVPAAGGSQRLPRLAGPTLANRMILLGEEIDAGEAAASGLVSEVSVKPDARAMELARTIAERGPIAERIAREAVTRGMEMPLEQALRYETDLTMILQTTEDRAEGVKAFLEKREPRFRGR